MAILKGIKLLHKRYTTEQWNNGNEPYVLYLGEFGINLDTGEVRGYTKPDSQKNAFVTWDNAQPISLEIITESGTGNEVAKEGDTFVDSIELIDAADGGKDYYKVTKKKLPGITVTPDDKSSEDGETFVSGITKVSDHEIKVTTKKIPSASLTITGGDGTPDVMADDVGSQSVVKTAYVLDNITGSSTNHEHEITKTFQEVTTAGYVDSRKLTVEAGTQGASQTGGTITYISGFDETVNEDGNHTVKYQTKQFVTPGVDGTAVGNVTANNTETMAVTGVKLEYDSTNKQYKLSGKEKTFVATDKNGTALSGNAPVLNIVGNNSEIQFQVDLSAYATKDDISAIAGAMTFRGTLGETSSITLENAINKINNGGGSAPLAGDTYKFTTNTGTYTGASFVLADGTTATSITPDRGDIITYTKSNGSGKWYLIPSGDEADGTVTTLKEGVGINFKDVTGTTDLANGELTSTGVIEHIKYTTTGASAIVTGATENSDDDEVYEFVESISTDKDGLGHVVGATKKSVTIPSWNNIYDEIEEREHITVVAEGDKIKVTSATSTNDDGNSVTTYTVKHDTVDTSTSGKTQVTAQAGSGRTYVTGVYRDAYGHISHVTTATETVQDTNTWREVKLNSEAFLGSATSTAALDIINGTNVTVAPTETAGQVKISTLGKASKDNYGFFKARYSTDSQVGVATPGDNKKSYGLGIDKDGYGYVTIDDPTTDRHHTVDDAKKQRDLGFYAISTDARGHIEALELITTLDGNMPDADGLDTNTTKDNQEIVS